MDNLLSMGQCEALPVATSLLCIEYYITQVSDVYDITLYVAASL